MGSSKKEFPIMVIGSGLAGLLTARLIAEHHSVLLITKNTLYDSNTQWSQGGIAAVWGDQDSVELHSKDTAAAGNGLCDPVAVEVLSRNSGEAIKQLVALGTHFDTDQDNCFLLGLEGAHSVHRILHANGDATGAEIQRALVEAVVDHANVKIHEHTLATELIFEQGHLKSVRLYHSDTNRTEVVDAQRVVLATGGAGQLFRYTSNPQVATGDGVVLAYRAGAQVQDLEFYQFHPTALNIPNVPNFLISEALRGEGAVLRNVAGEAFMARVHTRKDLAPRDIVSRAIVLEMAPPLGKNVYLDATNLAGSYLELRFPNILRRCLEYGLDIRKEWIPITPVAHYMCGGVVTDLWGRTSVPGLYACGEVARTGVHGANRLASNSLLEAAVFAMRVAQMMMKEINLSPLDQDNAEESQKRREQFLCGTGASKAESSLTLAHFQELMWQHVGVVRNEHSLQYMCRTLQNCSAPQAIPHSQSSYELESMKILGRLIAEAALERRESRGAHFREDYPLTSQNHSSLLKLRKSS